MVITLHPSRFSYRERDPLYPLEEKAGWAQGPVSVSAENRTPILGHAACGVHSHYSD